MSRQVLQPISLLFSPAPGAATNGRFTGLRRSQRREVEKIALEGPSRRWYERSRRTRGCGAWSHLRGGYDDGGFRLNRRHPEAAND